MPQVEKRWFFLPFGLVWSRPCGARQLGAKALSLPRAQEDTNKTLACAVPVHVPQTNALWWGEEEDSTKVRRILGQGVWVLGVCGCWWSSLCGCGGQHLSLAASEGRPSGTCRTGSLQPKEQHTNTFTSTNIRVSDVHCGSAVRFGQLLPRLLYYCAPLACVSAVMELLHNNKPKTR